MHRRPLRALVFWERGQRQTAETVSRLPLGGPTPVTCVCSRAELSVGGAFIGASWNRQTGGG